MKSNTNKLRINYLFYTILLYLVVSLYLKQDDTYMAFFYICLLILITSTIHVIGYKKLIRIEMLDDNEIRASKNNKVVVKIRIYNRMWVQTPYIYIFMNNTCHLESSNANIICTAIPPRSYKDVQFTYNAKYSGREIISLDKVVVQDYIGIIQSMVKISLDRVVNILPEIVDVKAIDRITQNISIGDVGELHSKESGLGEPSYELAPYKEGDSMKLVHWKLLARRDIWMAREREKMEVEYRIFTLVIDPIYLELEDRAKVIDKTVNVAITMANNILNRGDKISVVYNVLGDWETLEVVNKTSLAELGEILSRYNGTIENEVVRWPDIYLDKINRKNSSKIFITPRFDLNEICELEESNNLKVLSIMPSNILQSSDIVGWYLSDDYEVNRYV